RHGHSVRFGPGLARSPHGCECLIEIRREERTCRRWTASALAHPQRIVGHLRADPLPDALGRGWTADSELCAVAECEAGIRTRAFANHGSVASAFAVPRPKGSVEHVEAIGRSR